MWARILFAGLTQFLDRLGLFDSWRLSVVFPKIRCRSDFCVVTDPRIPDLFSPFAFALILGSPNLWSERSKTGAST